MKSSLFQKVLAFFTLLVVMAVPALAADVGVRVRFGLTDTEPTTGTVP